MDPIVNPNSPNPNPAGNPVVNPASSPAAHPAQPNFFINPDGTYVKDFQQHPSFPAELKDNQQIRTHTSVLDTLKNWQALEKIRGFDVVPVPSANSDPAVWDTVYDRLGRPKAPTEYQLPQLDDKIPADERARPEFVQGVLSLCHKAGLNQKQLDIIMPGWNALAASETKFRKEARKTAAAESLKPLREKWGAAFDNNRELVRSYVRASVPIADADRIAAEVLDDPVKLEWLQKQALAYRETEPTPGNPLPASAVSEAEIELRKMQADTKGPLYDGQHPLHADTYRRFQELVAIVEAARGRAK